MRIGRTQKFPGDLSGGVRADRLGKMQILRERDRLRDPIYGGAGREDKTFNPGHARGFEQMKSAVDVGVVVKPRMLNGWAHAGARSQMHDGIEFFAVK